MIDKKRDSRWSVAVRKKYFKRCPHCGKFPDGGVHHIISRSNTNTRYVLENGILTCFKFHRDFENINKKDKLIKMYIGEEIYKKLKDLSRGKISLEESGFTEIE